MNEEDEAFLQSMNRKRNASTQCSDDQFEEIMYAFEETAQAKQPYAAVDNPPVLTYEEMESVFEENLDESARPLADDIYEHWKSRRLQAGNRSFVTGLKVMIHHFSWLCGFADLQSSLRLVQIQMMRILTSAFGDGRFGRSAKLVVEMLTVRRS